MRRHPRARLRCRPRPSGQPAVQKARPFQLRAVHDHVVATRVSDIARRDHAQRGLHEPAECVVGDAAGAEGVPGLVVEIGVAEQRKEEYRKYASFISLEEGEGALGVSREGFERHLLAKAKASAA